MLRQYQTRFKFILVDEYQDTNVAQYLWLRLLAQRTARGEQRDHSPSLEGEGRTAEGSPGWGDREASPAAPPSPPPGSRREPTSLRGGFTLKTSAASATTTSRSMAGAAPRSTTSCASSTIFPAPR